MYALQNLQSLAGIAVVIITAVQLIGSNLKGTFSAVASAVAKPATS